MLRKDLVLSKTRALLDEYLWPMQAKVDKPRQRFLRQSTRGILLSGSLVVTELCHWIRDGCSDSFYRDKRLLNHLVSPRAHLDEAVIAYRQAMARYVGPDTPLIIDMTDLAKPRAKRMKYLARVRDGSEDKLVNGYWCIEAYAHLKHKRVLPLDLDAYSIEDPSVGSENLEIGRVIKAIHRDLNGNGVWVADRGFDRSELYETWFSLKSHFVVRQRADRTIVTTQGTRLILRDYVERLRQQRMYAGEPTNIIHHRLKLPDHQQSLYVVASWHKGKDDPLIVLTTLVAETAEQAEQILHYYRQRWLCEEAGQFLKGRVGLERFRVRRYEAMQNLALLALLAMGFLTWILLKSKDLAKRLFRFTSRFRKPAEFRYYRLLDGLQHFARVNPLLILTEQST